jgi:hypothetical protein
MDPRVRIAQSTLEQQYQMAHDVAILLDRTYDAYERAAARKDTKDAGAFARINGQLSFLIDIVDGADAPVPQGTTQAYCSLRMQALAALGATAIRNPVCTR